MSQTYQQLNQKKRRTIDVTVSKIIVSNIKINAEPRISIDTKLVIKKIWHVYMPLSILHVAGYISTIH